MWRKVATVSSFSGRLTSQVASMFGARVRLLRGRAGKAQIGASTAGGEGVPDTGRR